MNSNEQTTRHRRRMSRPLVASAAAVLVAAGLLAAIVVMPSTAHNHDAAAGFAGSAPATATRAIVPAEGSGSATPTATATSATAVPRASASPTPTRPTATGAARTPSSAAPLAGRIQPGTTYHGVATEYSAGDGNGACLFGPSADMMIAAMNYTDYESSKACGAHILVRAANGASITVLITNECPLPCAPGQLDLSQQAFARLADPTLGRIPITWRLLSPGGSGTVSIRYKTGSSRYWCGLQVIGHRNPVARLEVRAASGWRQLPRTDYDYFLSADGSGCGGAVRITDIYGQRLVIDGITLSPDVVQPAQVQFAQH